MGKASRRKVNNRPQLKMKKERNWFAIVVTFFVLALVAAVAIFVVVNNNIAKGPVKTPASASVNKTTGAIAIGKGKTVIDEYLDFGCPRCGEWETKSSVAVGDVLKRGLATLNIYPISILDNAFQGTKYSTRAASATYCVADTNSDAAYAYIRALYTNQPLEGTSGLTDEKLVSLAKDAGAPGAASCITSGKYKDFVTKLTKNTPIQPGAGGISTPTILVNGKFIRASDDPAITIVAVAEGK